VKPRIKILLVSHSNYIGGAELCFLEMLKSLHKVDHYDLYAVFPAQEGPLKKKCEEYCEATFTQYIPKWIDENIRYSLTAKFDRLISIVSSIRKSIRLIHNISPDVIITNTSSIPEFAFASKFTRTNHAWFIHELVEEGLNCHFIYGQKFSKRIIGLFSDFVISNSKFVYSNYSKYVSQVKLKTLYQSVEIKINNEGNQIENTKLTLLMMGNISEFKGQREAILACCELNKKNIDYQLLIIGAKPSKYLEELKGLVTDEYRDRIVFIPFSSTPEYFYKQSDIVLVCSKCESLGRVSIEAMKMGLPVVASNRGGNLELIKNGINGYLYQLYNPVDLAEKIMLLSDPNDRLRMGLHGKEWANRNFNKDKFSIELDALIKNMIINHA
jgi:glycosyltransferase involved in cell wall biosynthesis